MDKRNDPFAGSAPRANLPGLIENPAMPLALDGRGMPLKTVDNFLTALECDERFSGVRFNELTGAAEVHDDDEEPRRWTDADTARTALILESDYGLYAPGKLSDALRLLFEDRRYHPIRRSLTREIWDGVPRMETFLTRRMGCPDTPYVREVSRLIFSGGIHRLFEPGCKFDYVPVLVGPQGSGKSTIVRWLAMEDRWFTELTVMEGRESIEQLTGAWVCEIAELLALTRVKEQEAVKSFLSRQCDRYRKPYDRETTELKRQCIFIGTTNRRQFLKDRTGNRRFCPVEVCSDARALYAQEAEIRADIRQCWLEALAFYRAGRLSPVADPAALADFRAAQEEAMEEDWRVGAIERWVQLQEKDRPFCIREIAREALVYNEAEDRKRDPTPAESREIAQILDGLPCLERAGRKVLPGYGRQITWKRKILEN